MNKKPRGAEAGPDIRLFKEKTSKAKGADSAPKTRKKGHKKQNSHPENYYFLNIYKTNSSEKNSGGHMVKNLSIPDKMCANYEQSYPADYSPMNGHSACEKLNYIRRAIYDGSSAKLKIKDQRIVEHHHRSLSYGEKYNFGRRPASKSKNKSFYGGISDERKKSRKVSGINSGSRHSFLKKLRKIWKNSGKSLSNSKYKTYGYIMQSQYGGSKNAYPNPHYSNTKLFGSFNPAFSPNNTSQTPMLYDKEKRSNSNSKIKYVDYF